jgi:hypothetical protein
MARGMFTLRMEPELLDALNEQAADQGVRRSRGPAISDSQAIGCMRMCVDGRG